jgi:hypothetical protein
MSLDIKQTYFKVLSANTLSRDKALENTTGSSVYIERSFVYTAIYYILHTLKAVFIVKAHQRYKFLLQIPFKSRTL